jgi:hypothetical protein
MFNNQKSNRGQGLLLRTVLFLAALFIIGSPLASTSAGRVVTVGVYENAPKVFTDESGRPAGVFIDIIESIAQAEGWDLTYVSGTWGEGLDRLEREEINLMPDVAHTTEREKSYAFHKVPVLSSWFQVYARKGSGIQSILDLADKRIVVLERSVQQEAFSALAEGFGLNVNLIPLPDYRTSFDQVSKGDADAAITNRFYGMMHAKQFDLEDTTVLFNPSNLFFAAPRGTNAELLDRIDKHLARLKQDPQSTYYRSMEQWTSVKARFILPAWVKIVGLTAGIALFMSLAGSLLLKRQVNARTAELQQVNQDMEARIKQRTVELAAAMEQAQAADRIKSAFLATMSHELRTPLNSIIGFTGTLLQGLAGPLNEEQQKQMHMVQTSARHLLALINDVLDISKIEAGQLALSPAPFKLRDAIERTFKLVAPIAEKKGIGLKLEIGDDVNGVTTDQRRLEQILLNLFNNAVKFTEQGYVGIDCRTDDDHYRLSIYDTGIGILPEEIHGLFQPFHQIDTSLSRKHEGTGLGLSICQKLVEMMGGSIAVRSEWGKGSTFTVRIPRN